MTPRAWATNAAILALWVALLIAGSWAVQRSMGDAVDEPPKPTPSGERAEPWGAR